MDWNQIESSWLAMTRKVRPELADGAQVTVAGQPAAGALSQPSKTAQAIGARPFEITGKVGSAVAGKTAVVLQKPVPDDRGKARSN